MLLSDYLGHYFLHLLGSITIWKLGHSCLSKYFDYAILFYVSILYIFCVIAHFCALFPLRKIKFWHVKRNALKQLEFKTTLPPLIRVIYLIYFYSGIMKIKHWVTNSLPYTVGTRHNVIAFIFTPRSTPETNNSLSQDRYKIIVLYI